MLIGVYGPGTSHPSEPSVKNIRKILDQGGIRSFAAGPRSRPRRADCMLVLGGDKGVRSYFHHAVDPDVPVAGISEGELGGFLSQIDYKEFEGCVPRLKAARYEVEEVPRLGVWIDGKEVHPVLNDVAVFPSKSAMLMEHTLRVDGQEVWHDSGDGIILSTPMGSSAYSMSVGGPVIFQESRVFGIISVNSLDVTRRPLIVPDGGSITIDDVYAKTYCEAILDGIERYAVRKTVECTVSDRPARIIRLRRDSTAISALARKVDLAKELLSMPPSSKLLLKTLEYEGAMTQRNLASKTLLPDRTVRLALRHLLAGGYIKKTVSARDARQKIYEISKLE